MVLNFTNPTLKEKVCECQCTLLYHIKPPFVCVTMIIPGAELTRLANGDRLKEDILLRRLVVRDLPMRSRVIASGTQKSPAHLGGCR